MRGKEIGGVEEDRTPDLRIANATLSQLSYPPTTNVILANAGQGFRRTSDSFRGRHAAFSKAGANCASISRRIR